MTFKPLPLTLDTTADKRGISSNPVLNRSNRWLNAISIFVPMAGTVVAFLSLFYVTPEPFIWVLFVVFFWLSGAGVCIGLHRYFTHGTFKTGRVCTLVLGILGSWSWQGPVTRWVADHRRHHRFGDQPYDPHSPYWIGDKSNDSKLKGWIHSHFMWMLTGSVSDEERYAKDTLVNPVIAWCTRHYWLLAMSSLVLPAIVAALLGGQDWKTNAMLGFLWAGCARVALLHQLTWSVNSFAHMVGGKEADAQDQSRNIVILAILLLGEGLHSYHHRWPTTAFNRPLFLDMMGVTILVMERLGLVWDVRDPKTSATKQASG